MESFQKGQVFFLFIVTRFVFLVIIHEFRNAFGRPFPPALCLATCVPNTVLVHHHHALLEGRDYVTPQDVKWIAPDVLRHRISITYKAEAEGKDVEYIIGKILSQVETVS